MVKKQSKTPFRANSWHIGGPYFDVSLQLRILTFLQRIASAEKALEENYENEVREENEVEDKATKSSGRDNSTPPKLFLSYVTMVVSR